MRRYYLTKIVAVLGPIYIQYNTGSDASRMIIVQPFGYRQAMRLFANSIQTQA